jgi:hypothetical protein
MATPFAGTWVTREAGNDNALHTIGIGLDAAGHFTGQWSVAYPITTPFVCTATFSGNLIFSDISQVNVIKVVEHYTSFNTTPPNEPVSDGGGWPDAPLTLSLSSATAFVATSPDGSIETFTKTSQPNIAGPHGTVLVERSISGKMHPKAGDITRPCHSCNCIGWLDADNDGLCDNFNQVGSGGNMCQHPIETHY